MADHQLDARKYLVHEVKVGEGSTGEYAPEPLEDEIPRAAGKGLDGIAKAPQMTRHEHIEAVRRGEVGSLHSWELVTAMDGPGTRMTVFFAGCPLRCLYCHNPDTLHAREGTTVTAEAILDRMSRYKAVFNVSNGGVTFSGGEPLMQPAFLANLLRGATEMGIHTAIDTSGFLGRNLTDQMMADADLFLLDVKSGLPDYYERTTGRPLQPTIDFGRRLSAANKEIWARFVLVPGLTDDVANVEAAAAIMKEWTSLSRVEVLPFHQMARDKWASLGMDYQLKDVVPPSKEHTEHVREIFRSHGLNTF
ncbi:pyruvate formate-lyase-activating protein [Trueperella pecoris]|uniref:Pyruvate formate-lyase-activating enzyme n=1 Tax=Trueperella pecoris TaxID=2733571 RepID=A0A7M1QXI7_9ACTO|nr:pyruvate formate-lyase-activating protein [Trueperella pecoris]QOR46204.1 pyruvate formate lyase-activating protein [Trueperella pecoris]QTG76029.1 pyruvate formate lyase-activating protein [Trueperella pecoris]